MNSIYLDNAATSFPKANGVSDAIKVFLDSACCNIGRGSYERAQRAGLLVFETRERIRALSAYEAAKRAGAKPGQTSIPEPKVR